MKKCISLLLVAIFIFCSMPITTLAKTPANAVDIGLDCLGAAFDLTKSQELLRINTTSLIDADKAKNSNLTYGMQSGARTYAEYYSGKNIESYAQEAGIALSSEISEKINAGTLFKLDLSAKISANVKSAYSSSVESYFSTFKVTRKVGVNKMQLDTQEDYEVLRSVLSEQFLKTLLEADTEAEINALFDRFGTHFIAAYSLGGWAEATTSTVNTSSAIKNELEQAFSTSAGTEASNGAYGAGLSIAISAQEKIKSEYNTGDYKTSTYNEVFGGIGGMNFADASAANSVYNNWVSTIDPYNNVTTEIIVDDNMELIGIWDLLPTENTVQAAKMKQVFIDRLAAFNDSFVNTFIYSNISFEGIGKLSTTLFDDDSEIATVIPEGYIPIYTPAQFMAIGSGTYPLDGKYILMNDLDFKGASSVPIGGTDGTAFSGIFDGNGFTIRNIRSDVTGVTAVNYYYGLFGYNNGTIKNLVIDKYNITINTPDAAPIKDGVHNIGIVCGYNTGTIKNFIIVNSTIAHTVVVKNGKGNTITTILGGIAGTNTGTISFAFLKNTYLGLANTLWTASNSSVNKIILGGIAGISNGTVTDCYTKSCTVDTYLKSGHLTEYYYGGGEGGIFGEGHIPDAFIYRGEIIGYLSGNKSKVTRCFSLSNIRQGEYLLVHGAISEAHSNYRDCHIYLGQTIAYWEDSAANAISDCYYMSSDKYGSYINYQKTYDRTAPSGCSYMASLQASREIFITNGWEMNNNDTHPSFDISNRSLHFAVVYPSLSENIYQGDMIDDNVKVYLTTETPAYNLYKDITNESLLVYNFGNEEKGIIKLAYQQDGIWYIGEVELDLAQIQIDSITTAEKPTKTQYTVGDSFSSDGIVLKANYNNGSYAYITEDIVTDYDNTVFETNGEKTVTVTYEGNQTRFTINCFECVGTNSHTEAEAIKENIIEPTCTEDGSFDMVVYCSVCEKIISKTPTAIPAPGHDYTSVVTAPTCEDGGYTTYTCTVCGDNYKADETDAIGHNYIGTVTLEPTCTVPGVKTYVCQNDATHTYTTPIPAPGHDYASVVTAPTCEDGGYTTYTCTACGDTYTTDETDAIGHNYIGTVTLEPTCTVPGVKTYVCQNDATHTYTTPIPAPGHDYASVVTAPTCEDGGYTTYTCTVCGDTYTTDETDAIGHNYIGTVTLEPTCTVPGVKTYVCLNDASHTYTEEIPVTDHTWGDWTETIPATYTQEGEEIRTCEVCDAEEKRAIDKLPLPTKLIIYQPYTIAKESADGFAVVSVGTTVADILGASNGTHVLTATGEAAAAEAVLATGMVLAIMDGETVVDSMEIAVLGDVNGDGAHTSVDARTALRASVGLDTVTDVQLTAAKVNGGTALVANDARDILRTSVGLDDPKAWFEKF